MFLRRAFSTSGAICGTNWIALAPPLITTESEIDEMLAIVQASIGEVQAEVL